MEGPANAEIEVGSPRIVTAEPVKSEADAVRAPEERAVQPDERMMPAEIPQQDRLARRRSCHKGPDSETPGTWVVGLDVGK
jgi:hypothetical protein